MADPIMEYSIRGRQAGISRDNEFVVLNRSTNKLERIGGPSSLLGGAHNGATVARETRQAPFLSEVLTCTATPISISDDAGVAQYGGVKVFDFPDGLIAIYGAIVTGALTGYASLIDTFAGGVALGTATATTGATLTGTEANIMPEVDVAAAVGEVATIDAVSVATALTESHARIFDGTATAIDMYLNFVIDDNAAHGAGTATFTGTIKFMWALLGDN